MISANNLSCKKKNMIKDTQTGHNIEINPIGVIPK
jgi:hypothetical protein